MLSGESDSPLTPKHGEGKECLKSEEHGEIQWRHERGSRELVRNGTGGDTGSDGTGSPEPL